MTERVRRYNYVRPTAGLSALISELMRAVPRSRNVTITLYSSSEENAPVFGHTESPIVDIKKRKEMFDNLPSRTVEKGEPETACAICLAHFEEGEKLTKLLCLHEMHSECAWEWLKGHSTCPVCRFETI